MYEYTARVGKVHDGDTIRFDVDLGFDIHHASLDVRLLGIDCPELRRPDRLGEKARDFVISWFAQFGVPYVLIRTVKDEQEKYGRYLAIVVGAEGRSLSDDLLSAGFAKIYDGTGPRPTWP